MKVEINGMAFEPIPGVKYKYDYCRMVRDAKAAGAKEIDYWHNLLKDDLWAMVYFGLKVSVANHPFWVEFCRRMEVRGKKPRLIWAAREHAKTTVVTIAQTIQDIVKDCEERIAIFSFSQKAAVKIFRAIKQILEESQFLKDCFADVLWDKPEKQAPKWAEETGLIVRRRGFYKEATLEAWGLIEGMPTGGHFTKRKYDDVETADFTYTPEITQRLKDQFDMSQNLGTIEGTHDVLGTPYHHEGLLTYLEGKLLDGEPLYEFIRYPATEDGTPNGKSVWLPEHTLAERRAQLPRAQYFSQYLLNPTPKGVETLDPQLLQDIEPQNLPGRLYKFIAIDPAGTSKDGKGDSWGIICAGVDPYRDDIGASHVFLLDMVIEQMTEAEAVKAVVDMYLRNGRILKLGVEKVSMITAEMHIANALRAKGVNLTLESGNLVLLRPGGRSKEERIEKNLMWPLTNGKLWMSTKIPAAFRQRLRMEMEKFPYSRHDDGIDALAYIYDLMKDYRFGTKAAPEIKQKKDAWADAFDRQPTRPRSWLYV